MKYKNKTLFGKSNSNKTLKQFVFFFKRHIIFVSIFIVLVTFELQKYYFAPKICIVSVCLTLYQKH